MIVAIVGFEGKYQVTEEGHIISCTTGNRMIGAPTKTSPYLYVKLYLGNKIRKSKSIHRLVAESFVPNPDNLPQVNHIDGNIYNNHASNLEWCDQSYNIQHSYDNGSRKYRPMHYKGKSGSLHNRSKSVKCLETKENFGSMSEAARENNCSVSSIHWSIKTGKPIFGMHFQLSML